MNNLIKYGVITDDPKFAASISSYLSMKHSYVPIISLPRMTRADWEGEVIKRTTAINRSTIQYLFCQSSDYEKLAPFRKYSKAEIIPIKKSKHILRFVEIELKPQYIGENNNDYLIDYLKAIQTNKTLKVRKKNNNIRNEYLMKNNSDTLLVLERTGEVTDISAINYAFAYDYDVMIINKIKKEFSNDISNCLVMFSNMNIVSFDDGSMNNKNINRLLNFLDKRLSYLLNYKDIEKKYKRIQIVTMKTYLGILIKSIPVTHLLHLQADIHFLNEYYYLNKYKVVNEKYLPSCLFVDTQEADLSSEIPEISSILSEFKIWKFHLNGKYANKANFTIFSHFFPYDLLLISGHGTSPDARIVNYKFKSRNGSEHTAKLLEYYQIGKASREMIEVEQKYYPLEFDGIPWKDKKLLKKMKISHIFLEFTIAGDNLTLINYKTINLNKIEGIKLYDGVFMGNISSFEFGNNPIIILNSCGSLAEAGKLVSFGLPRILIGTLWPVLDKSANNFAVKLFDNINNNSILDSFQISKSNIEDDYTRYSYIILGTLNQFLPISNSISDKNIAEENMMERLHKSMKEILRLRIEGIINPNDVNAIVSFINVCNKFMEEKYPDNYELKSDLVNLRRVFNID